VFVTLAYPWETRSEIPLAASCTTHPPAEDGRDDAMHPIAPFQTIAPFQSIGVAVGATIAVLVGS